MTVRAEWAFAGAWLLAFVAVLHGLKASTVDPRRNPEQWWIVAGIYAVGSSGFLLAGLDCIRLGHR